LPKSRDPIDQQMKQIGLQQAQRNLDQPKPTIVPEGASVVVPDGQGGYKPVAAGGAKQTDAIRNYQYYVQQEQAAGRPPKNMDQWQTDQKKAGATNINTAPGPTGKVFETMSTRADEARAAAGAMPAFSEAQRLVNSGQITLGAGADMRVAMQKVGALFGLDPTSAANAETFRASMAPTVLSLVKGLGSGSGISNADRDFAERAAGGNINLEPMTIKRLIDIGAKAAQYKIDSHNRTLDQVYPEGDDANRQVRSLFRVDVPKYEPPATPTAQNPVAPAIQQAREAIQRGADPNKVRERLMSNGIDPAGL
jgi:hypothetical protein